MSEVNPVDHTECVLAIDFGGTKIDVAVATPAGVLLRRERHAIDHSASAQAIVEDAFARALHLADWATQEFGAAVSAAAIASPGIVQEQGIDLAPNVGGWTSLRLPETARRTLQLPFVIGNDVNFATQAELTSGALRGVRNGVYLGLGTGIGAGLVVGGRLVRGQNGIAGEIGYIRTRSGSILEDQIGGRAIEASAAAVAGREVRASEVFESATGPLAAVAVRAVDALTEVIENIVWMLDPERIVVGGGVSSAPSLIHDLKLTLSGHPYPVDIRAGEFVHDAVVRGLAIAAGELALRKEPSWS
ncbi:ROK family protein [Leifsonia sp. 21MFCrub1.1]|uniref:ROK family protein n=1 Tax=Leifsonia sp. 21MFCrub1.1 TaxID=1798223 RepID=UPI00089290C0|nr:ROK family protein [Leifsonia sp. 21MFCrub1.1]SEB09524.1 glucokinase [Leifsonia sp. 21MFCrub1.1]